MHMHANGECGENPDREPLNLLKDQNVSMGLFADEHHEDCDYRVSQACGDEGYDCNLNCETEDFSMSWCEGCGSQLGGSRHAMTVHWDDD
jgi:hypothetical protein